MVQMAWIWGMDETSYDRGAHNFGPSRHVLQTHFQFGTSAYLVSKRGMENILDAYITDRAETGQIRLRRGDDQAEVYIYGAISNLYVAVPTLHTVGVGAVDEKGVSVCGAEERMCRHIHPSTLPTHPPAHLLVSKRTAYMYQFFSQSTKVGALPPRASVVVHSPRELAASDACESCVFRRDASLLSLTDQSSSWAAGGGGWAWAEGKDICGGCGFLGGGRKKHVMSHFSRFIPHARRMPPRPQRWITTTRST